MTKASAFLWVQSPRQSRPPSSDMTPTLGSASATSALPTASTSATPASASANLRPPSPAPSARPHERGHDEGDGAPVSHVGRDRPALRQPHPGAHGRAQRPPAAQARASRRQLSAQSPNTPEVETGSHSSRSSGVSGALGSSLAPRNMSPGLEAAKISSAPTERSAAARPWPPGFPAWAASRDRPRPPPCRCGLPRKGYRIRAWRRPGPQAGRGATPRLRRPRPPRPRSGPGGSPAPRSPRRGPKRDGGRNSRWRRRRRAGCRPTSMPGSARSAASMAWEAGEPPWCSTP